MQKAFGPKPHTASRDKYPAALKGVAAFILVLISSAAFSQSYQPPGYAPKVNSYGNWYNRLHADSAVHIPRKYAFVLNDNDTTPQLMVFNDTLYYFSRGSWFSGFGTGGGGTTYTADGVSLQLIGSQFSIKPSWTGQTGINTLGTITTGIWNSTAIADAYIASSAVWNAKQTSALTTGNIWVGQSRLATSVLRLQVIGTMNSSGVSTLANVVSPGSCSSCNLTYDAKGRITVAGNGSVGGAPFPDNAALVKITLIIQDF